MNVADECRWLLFSFSSSPDQKSGASPIHHATWDGRLDIVELLLARKAEIDHQTRRGYARQRRQLFDLVADATDDDDRSALSMYV